jgi:phage terminase small subunit
MGKRGPKPRPTELKRLHHTIRTPDRKRGPDALAPGGGLVPPDYFTPAMQERWAEILRLAPLNVLRPIDATTLADFVAAEAIADQAYAECSELIVVTERGRVRNPALLIYFRAVEQKKAAADRLGFSPSARVGLPVDEHTHRNDPEDDRWAELAKGVWRPGKFHPGTRIPIDQPLPGSPSKRLARKLREAEKAETLAKAEPKGEA